MTHPNMSRDDLKKHIRALDHELELSTFINKGAIQEVKELKLRVAELEQENTALRTTEARLTDTEERLEESEDAVKEKESQIERLKDAVNGLKNSLRNAVKERDDWSNRWGRAADFFAKEEEDIADTAMDQATQAFSTVKQKAVNNPFVRRRKDERAQLAQSVEDSPSTLSALFDEDEAGGPSKVRTDPQASSKKRRRRIGEESTPEDEPYKPARPVTPLQQGKTRPLSVRERKKPAIQLGVVKLETPTPEPEPVQPIAPSKSARRRKRRNEGDDADESDDAIGQW